MATAALLAVVFQSDFKASASSNALFSDPAASWHVVGVKFLVHRLERSELEHFAAWLLIIALAIGAAFVGFGISRLAARDLARMANANEAAGLALAFSSTALAVLVIGASGFSYKLVLLMPTIPLLSMLSIATSRLVRSSALCILTLMILSFWLISDVVTSTLMAISASGFSLGASLGLWVIVYLSHGRSVNRSMAGNQQLISDHSAKTR